MPTNDPTKRVLHEVLATTRNAARMNGWIRQKYVYVPGGRSVGVFQVS